MTSETFKDIERLESDLWEAADNLRANFKLASSDYFMPVLGVIFLRHAGNRFQAATRQIEEDQANGRMPKRSVRQEYYTRRLEADAGVRGVPAAGWSPEQLRERHSSHRGASEGVCIRQPETPLRAPPAAAAPDERGDRRVIWRHVTDDLQGMWSPYGPIVSG